MYLNIEEDRPDTPRVHAPISRFRGIELSLVFHALFVVVFLVAPGRFAAALPDERRVVPPDEPVRFVHMVPLVERNETPLRRPEHSDLDRRSRSPVRPRDAENTRPFSAGDTPEKVVGAPVAEPAPPALPAAPAAAPASDASGSTSTGVAIPTSPPVAPAANRALSRSLRDLRQYLQKENFDNQRGGLTEDGPDIQFDSKGVEFGPWLRRFVAQVKSNWYVPQSAMILSGRVVIQFYVEKNGAITELRIVSPSDVDAFNRASFSAIRTSNPTLPLPAEYPLPRALFTVTFLYNERLAP
jgi:TonB family protein